MQKKWWLLGGYFAALILIYIYRDSLMMWLDHKSDAADLYLIGLATVLAFFPIIPFGIVAGVLGAKYGAAPGMLLSILSSVIAAAVMFGLARSMFRESMKRNLMKYRWGMKLNALFERNNFMAVFVGRIIPIFPAQAVNIYASLTGMAFLSFMIATIVGKLPVMFTFSWIGDKLNSNPGQIFIVVIFYLLYTLIVYGGYRLYMSKSAS